MTTLLSHFAGGRRLAEAEDPLRTAFQRDRDRILHSTAFRRLQGKTQVVAAFENWWDKYRVTLTDVERDRDAAAAALRAFLRGLGYA